MDESSKPPPRKVHEVEVLPPEDETPVHQAAAGVEGITKGRKIFALIVAGVSDAISVFAEFVPPVQIAVDVVTGCVLFAVLGFRWPLLPVLVIEAIPGLAAFPTWVLAVGVLAGVTPTRPNAPQGPRT
jgi:hypothetical protein